MKTLTSACSENLDLKNPLSEYPRMYLKRDSYLSLNGEWEYQIVKDNETFDNQNWQMIIVPFAIGSKLSCAKDTTLGIDETLFWWICTI